MSMGRFTFFPTLSKSNGNTHIAHLKQHLFGVIIPIFTGHLKIS